MLLLLLLLMLLMLLLLILLLLMLLLNVAPDVAVAYDVVACLSAIVEVIRR